MLPAIKVARGIEAASSALDCSIGLHKGEVASGSATDPDGGSAGPSNR